MTKRNKNIVYGIIIALSVLFLICMLFKVTNTTLPFSKSYTVKYENGIKTVTYYNNKNVFDSNHYVAKQGTISGIQSTNILVKSGTSLTISGMVNGNIKIENGASINISGTVDGDVIVENGARANVSGMVNGSIYNSGTTNVYGMVNGDIFKRAGNLYVDSNASVQGVIQ